MDTLEETTDNSLDNKYIYIYIYISIIVEGKLFKILYYDVDYYSGCSIANNDDPFIINCMQYKKR
jgi:hypothetical protein